jgi:hypothetical protein
VHGAVAPEHAAQRLQSAVRVFEVVQDTGADDQIELTLQRAGYLEKAVPEL